MTESPMTNSSLPISAVADSGTVRLGAGIRAPLVRTAPAPTAAPATVTDTAAVKLGAGIRAPRPALGSVADAGAVRLGAGIRR